MSRNGELVPGSMAHRMAEFFAANEDEELTGDDACVKFGLSREQLRETLRSLRGRGVVEVTQIIRAKRG